ncbi:MAG: YgiT-type zinc finger protein [Desulfobacteraceae bacterium]|nr:YgiT-type zinc finger protein [Desulfobacteraceae bacterium]
MYKNGDRCQICGSGRLTKKVIKEKFECKGEVLTIPDCIIYECSACEEAVVDENTLKATEKAIRDFQKKSKQISNFVPGNV